MLAGGPVNDTTKLITVVSTGFRAPTKQRCLDSVAAQLEPHEHCYIEASEQDPPLTVTENVWRACRELPPDRVVVWLDGDDSLASDTVLTTVRGMHEAGADCTYGSFRFSDGRKPAMRAYEDYCNCRREPWLGTHLKTFRAGLLASVPADELKIGGEWIDMACDMALMFPILERAERAVFCPLVLCVYNYASSWEHRFTAADRAREAAIVRELRSR